MKYCSYRMWMCDLQLFLLFMLMFVTNVIASAVYSDKGSSNQACFSWKTISGKSVIKDNGTEILEVHLGGDTNEAIIRNEYSHRVNYTGNVSNKQTLSFCLINVIEEDAGCYDIEGGEKICLYVSVYLKTVSASVGGRACFQWHTSSGRPVKQRNTGNTILEVKLGFGNSDTPLKNATYDKRIEYTGDISNSQTLSFCLLDVRKSDADYYYIEADRLISLIQLVVQENAPTAPLDSTGTTIAANGILRVFILSSYIMMLLVKKFLL